MVAFFITGLLGYVISLKFLEPRFHSGKIVNIIKAIQDENMLEGVSQIKNNKNFYVNKVGGNGDQTLFVGDSNMMQYAPRIRFLLGRNTVNKRGAIMITKGGTPPILNTRKNNICESAELFDEVNKQISSNPKIDKIVIAARWTIYFDDASPWTIDSVSLKKEVGQNKAIKSLGESIKKLVEKGKKVTLVLNIPTGWKLDPRNRVKRDFAGMSFPEIPVFYKKDFMKGNESVLKNIYFVGTQNGANVINPLDYLCTNGICRNDDEDGISIYFNEGHLRPGFVRDHVKYLDETVQP